MSEHNEQVRLFAWAKDNENWIPVLKNLFAIPNGGKRKNGWWEKSEGLKAGVPDLFLACPRWNHPKGMINGLFIEMKYGKNKCTPAQKDWHERLKGGYQVAVCYSFEEARDTILDYLKVEQQVDQTK